jgi:hypothetical protein
MIKYQAAFVNFGFDLSFVYSAQGKLQRGTNA